MGIRNPVDIAMGAKAVVAREVVGLPDKAAIEQPALFSENTGVCEAGGGEIAPAAAARGPGRPPGAENRDTVDMRRYLASLGYRPGQIALGEVGAGATLDELIARARKIAVELPCKPIEAMKLVMAAAGEFATYTGSKVQAPAAAAALPAGVVLLQVTADQAAALAENGLVFVGPQKPAESADIVDVTPRQSDSGLSDT